MNQKWFDGSSATAYLFETYCGAIGMRARDQGETVQLSKVRIKESLRALLQKEAEAQRTTMNAVIADRLQRSFDAESDVYRGPQTARLFRTLAAMIEAHRGDEWLSDPDLYNEIIDRWSQQFNANRPRRAPDDEKRMWSEYEEFKSLMQAHPDSQALQQIAKRTAETGTLDPAWRARWAALGSPHPDEDESDK